LIPRKIIALLIALQISTAAVHAQLVEDYRFKGTVTDLAGKPIPEVQVTFQETVTRAVIAFKTSEAGIFDRRMIPHGTYEVRFEKPGYVTRVETFDWKANAPDTIVKEAQIQLESEGERARRELGKKEAKLYEAAYAALAAGDCAAAKKNADELLGLGAGTYEYAVRFVLARCHAMQEEIDAAIEEYRRVAALKPDLFEAHFDLGLVLAKKGSPDAALEEFAKAAEIKPSDAETQYNMGAILFQKKDLEAARPHLEKAVASDSTHAQAAKVLGFVLLQSEQKDLVGAERMLRRYLALQPGARDAEQIRDVVKSLEAEHPAKK
jgi:tetratricopeptide (TPR) repeat protein